MRLAGFILAALMLSAAIAAGQPPVGGAPVAPAAQPDPKLDEHLGKWEKTMGDLSNFRFELSLKKTEVTFKQDKPYSGVVLCMKPNYAVLRLNYDGDKTGADYEAYISDGKAVYQYSGLEKTITRWKFPDPKANPAGATDNLMLDFLSGMKAKDAKQRFNLSVFKEDANYVYLDVLPVLAKDKAEFQQLRMALYGPSTKFAYLPAQVFLVKPNGDTEQWKFTGPQTNIQGLTEKNFQYQDVKGWTVVEGKIAAPPPPPAGRPGQPTLPGATGLPPGGGAVRPNK